MNRVDTNLALVGLIHCRVGFWGPTLGVHRITSGLSLLFLLEGLFLGYFVGVECRCGSYVYI